MERITLPLTKGQVAIIDAEDFEREAYVEFRNGKVWTGRICDRRWAAQKSRQTLYAFQTVKIDGREMQLYLHRVVMDAGRLQLIDHRDCNGLHCWRDNLRLATSQGNCHNRRPRGERKYKGAYFHKASGKYTAAIGVNGKSIHLGLFDSEEAAARAYDAAAIRQYGEFAKLNFPLASEAPQ